LVILKLQSEFEGMLLNCIISTVDNVSAFFISDNVSASRTRLLLFYLQFRHATTAAIFWLGRIIRVGPSLYAAQFHFSDGSLKESDRSLQRKTRKGNDWVLKKSKGSDRTNFCVFF
jgi:hypothetical protein